MKVKALLIIYNSNTGLLFIQDRQGHKPPPWGFFGGTVEAEETVEEAVIREAKEELALELSSSDISLVAVSQGEFDNVKLERHLYLFKTTQTDFTVLEGAGGEWVNFTTMLERIPYFTDIDLEAVIKKLV